MVQSVLGQAKIGGYLPLCCAVLCCAVLCCAVLCCLIISHSVFLVKSFITYI
ncbi:hypothetical protein PNF27_01635 [Lactococcus garvieae]|nr:hypothetical protein [Lactococcus garvieae]